MQTFLICISKQNRINQIKKRLISFEIDQNSWTLKRSHSPWRNSQHRNHIEGVIWRIVIKQMKFLMIVSVRTIIWATDQIRYNCDVRSRLERSSHVETALRSLRVRLFCWTRKATDLECSELMIHISTKKFPQRWITSNHFNFKIFLATEQQHSKSKYM